MTRDVLVETAKVWSGGFEDRCAAGHGPHETVVALTNDGHDFIVFHPEAYRDTKGYCEGDDEVSRAVIVNGDWETGVTRLFDMALKRHPGPVIDIGAHVGWFTVRALRAGHTVLAVDASEEHFRVLRRNVNALKCELDLVTCRGWIDKKTPVLDENIGLSVVKIDIEGLEGEAVRVIEPTLQMHRVHSLFLEVSPVFTGLESAIDTVTRVLDAGYQGFIVPDNNELDRIPRQLEHVRREHVRVLLSERPQRDLYFRL